VYYKIYYLEDGKQNSLPREYKENERKKAENLIKELNRNRNMNDPYFWLQPMHEVIKGD
jgi:hypothetical protein